jgi:small multidrug resistance family-3 protein
MTLARSLVLFVLAAWAEIGGAWLVARNPGAPRSTVDRRRRDRACEYGFVATLQPDANFGRILAAYGGVFVACSLAWAWSWTSSSPTGAITSVPRSAWSALL